MSQFSTPSKVVPESIIIYLDVFGKILSKKDIIKTIESFMGEKQKKNPNTGFTIYFFKENSEPFVSNEFVTSKELEQIIENDWKTHDTSASNFENGLFFCLSILVSKAVKGEGVFRVVVVSDSPSKKSAEYAEALMELVETIRTFPTFIDIIRIGKEEIYKDDVKLRLITTLTGGALLYAQDSKSFKSSMEGLAKNKILPDLRPEGGQSLDRSKTKFFENWSKQLAEVDPSENARCQLCTNVQCNFCNDEADVVQKCPNCGTFYHECCAALYSWRHNLGLKHIFRCMKCGILIKLNEESVYAINGEVIQNDPLMKETEEFDTQNQETWSPTEVEASPEKIPENPPVATQGKGDQTSSPKPVGGGGFGLFGQRIVPKKTAAPSDPVLEMPKENKPTTAFTRSSLAKRRRVHDDDLVCRICSAVLKPGMRICPQCKSPII
jgi:hypothetical protein